jgi:RHS repeat-associated protein
LKQRLIGAFVQQMDYDGFGRVLWDTAPGFQRFGFGGGLYDPDTGSVRFGLRDYDRLTGQWMSRDPIGFAGGDCSLFNYVRNDPL